MEVRQDVSELRQEVRSELTEVNASHGTLSRRFDERVAADQDQAASLVNLKEQVHPLIPIVDSHEERLLKSEQSNVRLASELKLKLM